MPFYIFRGQLIYLHRISNSPVQNDNRCGMGHKHFEGRKVLHNAQFFNDADEARKSVRNADFSVSFRVLCTP